MPQAEPARVFNTFHGSQMRSAFPATVSPAIMAHSEIEFRNDLGTAPPRPQGRVSTLDCITSNDPPTQKAKRLHTHPLYLSSKDAREVPRLRRRLSSGGDSVAGPPDRLCEQTR